MGNIINFMEKLGASAEFQVLSETEALSMLQQAYEVDDEQEQFYSAVEMLLDPRKNLVCGVMPAEEPSEKPSQDDAPVEPDDSEETKAIL